ncbi:MAG: ATP-binding protein [Desulfobacula sp.]|nr:ATP-binding protein [Desulfobacula sp.]
MAFKKKILIGYGIIFILMGLVVAWAVIHLVMLGKAGDAILKENYRSILAAENMVDALERQDSAILLFFMEDLHQGIAQFRENEAVFLEWLARAKDNITIPGEAALVKALESDYTAYRHRFSELTDLRDRSKPLNGLSIYQETVYPLFIQVRKKCIDLRYLNEETMYKASIQAGMVSKQAIGSTVVVAVSALAVALVFCLVLANRIVRPLQHFMSASRRISSGDYTARVPMETGDELGLLAGEFNRMADQIRQYHEMNIEQIISEKNKGDAILSSIEDGLLVFDTRLKATGINPAARRMLGLTTVETALPECVDILPDPKVCDMIRKTVETGVHPDLPDEQRMMVFSEKDQSHHYLFSVRAIRGSSHDLTGIVLLLRDVTRMKEVEQLKNEFIMAASHELRTPLTGLGMSVDLLLEHAAPSLSEKNRDLLQAAHEEVHRMKALVSDLLDMSGIEGGRIEMEFENVQVSTLFDHAQTVFKNQTDMKGVELSREMAAGLPGVRADANKITWVLTNLISNALRYVQRGGHIKLRARRIDPHIHLSVQDDGPGIPPEYHTRVFQKFVQVKGRETGGTGLGLAICKEIVRAHGGAIWVESSQGLGSTFTFTLPIGQ